MSQMRRQDMPPKGGYPAVRWKQHLPKHGLSGRMTYVAVAAAMGVGLYLSMQGVWERNRTVQKEWPRKQQLYTVLKVQQAERWQRTLEKARDDGDSDAHTGDH